MPGELSEVRPRDQAEDPIANASFPQTPISAPQAGRGCRAATVFGPGFDRLRVSEQIAVTTVGCRAVRRRPRKHTSQQRLSVPAGRGKDYRDTVNRGNSGQPPGLLQRAKNQTVVPHPDAVPSPVLDTGSCRTFHSRHPRAKRRTSRPSHNHTLHSPYRRSPNPSCPPSSPRTPMRGRYPWWSAGRARLQPTAPNSQPSFSQTVFPDLRTPSSPTQIVDPGGRGYPHQPATQPHPARSPTTPVGAVRERPWYGARLQPTAPNSLPAFSQPVVPSIVSPHSDAGPVPTVGRRTGAATRRPPHSTGGRDPLWRPRVSACPVSCGPCPWPGRVAAAGG